MNPLLCFVYMYIIKEQQTEIIKIKYYHDNLHVCKGIWWIHIFTLLSGAPSLVELPYSINELPEKKCSFSVTLVWSPYAYSPWFSPSINFLLPSPVQFNTPLNMTRVAKLRVTWGFPCKLRKIRHLRRKL